VDWFPNAEPGKFRGGGRVLQHRIHCQSKKAEKRSKGREQHKEKKRKDFKKKGRGGWVGQGKFPAGSREAWWEKAGWGGEDIDKKGCGATGGGGKPVAYQKKKGASHQHKTRREIGHKECQKGKEEGVFEKKKRQVNVRDKPERKGGGKPSITSA